MCQLFLRSPCLLFGSFATEQIGRLVWKPSIRSKCEVHWLVEETWLRYCRNKPLPGLDQTRICCCNSSKLSSICWAEPSGCWSFDVVKMQGWCLRVSLLVRCLPALSRWSAAPPFTGSHQLGWSAALGNWCRKWWLLGVKRIKWKVLKCHRVQRKLQIGVSSRWAARFSTAQDEINIHISWLKPHTRLLAGGQPNDLEVTSARLLGVI